MDREDIKEVVLKAVAEIQECSGRPVAHLSEDSCPIGGLEGFDSLNSVEVTCMISQQLGFEVDAKLFIPNREGQPVTIGQAIDQLCAQYETHQQGGKEHERQRHQA